MRPAIWERALYVHACCGRVRARQPSHWACLDNASVLREPATSTLRAPRRLFAATSYHALTTAPLHLPTDWPAAAARSATHLSQQPCPAILPSHRYVLLMEEKTSMPAGHACAPFFFLVLHVSLLPHTRPPLCECARKYRKMMLQLPDTNRRFAALPAQYSAACDRRLSLFGVSCRGIIFFFWGGGVKLCFSWRPFRPT